MADRLGIPYFETSAKTDRNVVTAFKSMAADVRKQRCADARPSNATKIPCCRLVVESEQTKARTIRLLHGKKVEVREEGGGRCC